MAVLDMRRKGARALMNHPALKDKEIIGRGSFCSVFDNGRSVLKMTTDVHQYDLYTAGMDNPIFPKLHKSYGQIGLLGESPVYLVEMEKLEEIDRDSQAFNFIKKIRHDYAKVFPCHDENYTEAYCSTEALIRLSEQESFSPRLKSGLLDLADFMVGRSCTADFHHRNFMTRGSQIVFNDPVCDYLSIHNW